jgi:hypothetical protein
VTRDDDLLSLGAYEDIAMVTPEAFLTLVRSAESGDDYDACEGGGVVDTRET